MKKEAYLKLRKEIKTPPREHAVLFHLGFDALLWAACVGLAQGGPWARMTSIPLLSALMFRGFSLMHEAVHGAVSTFKPLNNLIGLLAGGLCFLPYAPWKKVHLEHHYWTGNVEKDSVMALIDIIPRLPKSVKFVLNSCWKLWIPLLAFLQYTVFWVLSAKHFLKTPRSFYFFLNLALPPLLWAAIIYAMPKDFSLNILAPALVLYLLAVEVVNFPHHLELPQFRGDTRLPLWEQHLTSRSCVYPQWVARFIVLNFNYHTEHHLFPEAPWYYLREIHLRLKAELQQSYNSDPQFVWILKNRRRGLEQVLAETVAPAEGGEGSAA